MALLSAAIVVCCASSCVPNPRGKASAAQPKLTISPGLGALTRHDVRVLARGALARMVREFPTPVSRRYYLGSRGALMRFHQDGDWRDGELELSYIGSTATDVFGDYASLPPAVKADVLPERPQGVVAGGMQVYPLSVWEVTVSEAQRKVQITLGWECTICATYTFLYRVERDGALAYLRSMAMGCCQPGGRLIDTFGASPSDTPLPGARSGSEAQGQGGRKNDGTAGGTRCSGTLR
jgi:hypothetical protein